MQGQKTHRPWGEDEDNHSQQNYVRVRKVHRHEQKMSISPHASEALVQQHALFWDLLRRVFAVVLLAGHEVDRIYRKRERPLWSSARAEKSKGTGTVASADVFKAGALGQYLKPRNEAVDVSGCAKGNSD